MDTSTIERLPRSFPTRPNTQTLLERAAWLQPRDRTILELAIGRQVPRQQIARMLDLDAGTVTRRLHRVAARLHDPLVVALLNENSPLAPPVRRLGIEHFLVGLSARQL